MVRSHFTGIPRIASGVLAFLLIFLSGCMPGVRESFAPAPAMPLAQEVSDLSPEPEPLQQPYGRVTPPQRGWVLENLEIDLAPFTIEAIPPNEITNWQEYLSHADVGGLLIEYQFEYPDNWFVYPGEAGEVLIQTYPDTDQRSTLVGRHARLQVEIDRCAAGEICLIPGDAIAAGNLPGSARVYYESIGQAIQQEVMLQKDQAILRFTLTTTGEVDDIVFFRQVLSYLLSTLEVR